MPVMTGLSDQTRVPNEFCHKRVGGRSCLCYNYSLSYAFSHSLCTVHVGALYHLSTLCLLPIPLPYSMSLSSLWLFSLSSTCLFNTFTPLTSLCCPSLISDALFYVSLTFIYLWFKCEDYCICVNRFLVLAIQY